MAKRIIAQATTGANPAVRDEQGRFPKGISGNPGGRPSAAKKVAGELAAAVREKVSPDVLVQGMWDIAQGQSINGLEPKLSDVLEARKWLADRGWGRPADFKPVDEEDPLGLADAHDRLVGKLAPVVEIAQGRGESKG